MTYKGYKDKDKRREYKKLQMREYRQHLRERVRERLKRLELASLEKAGYKNEIKILRASISLMLSPAFQKQPVAEQLKRVEFMDDFIKADNRERVFPTVRDTYRKARPEIEVAVEKAVFPMLKREFKVEQIPPGVEGLLSHESLVDKEVESFMRIEEVKKTKPQPGLI